jgi:phospholipid/cholesterol/gamma-HCH transport system substrate-binding protein
VSKKPPGIGRVLVAIAFALSCFGLALFLWTAFGGPVPLQAQGYRFHADFNQANQLAEQSDVRISGVTVGKVVNVALAPNGLADATIQMDDKYAPIPRDTRAILRQKTLLGETYVELTPGSRNARSLPEGGQLPQMQVAPSVQLDEIFRTFNARTRRAFRQWMAEQAVSLHGRGADLNAALGELVPFTSAANKALRILDTQRQAVRQLVNGGAETFGALSQRQGELRSLIQRSATVFDTTARRNRDLARTFQILPTFQDESRKTLARLERFAKDANPLVVQLRPAAKQLTPTLEATRRLAPHLDTFFTGLRQAIPAGVKGLPALRGLLSNDLPPLLQQANPFLRQLDPILTVLNHYRHELTAFFANGSAALNGFNVTGTSAKKVRYVRTTNALGPEVLAGFPRRLRTSRTNPYLSPKGYLKLGKGGLQSFETRQCSGGIDATLDPATPSDPSFQARATATATTPTSTAADLFARIVQFAFAGQTSADAIPQASCRQQPPFRSIGISPEMTRFLHVREEK